MCGVGARGERGRRGDTVPPVGQTAPLDWIARYIITITTAHPPHSNLSDDTPRRRALQKPHQPPAEERAHLCAERAGPDVERHQPRQARRRPHDQAQGEYHQVRRRPARVRRRHHRGGRLPHQTATVKHGKEWTACPPSEICSIPTADPGVFVCPEGMSMCGNVDATLQASNPLLCGQACLQGGYDFATFFPFAGGFCVCYYTASVTGRYDDVYTGLALGQPRTPVDVECARRRL